MSDTDDDLFSDVTTSTKGEGDSKEFDEPEKAETEETESDDAELESDAEESVEAEQEGDEEASETPDEEKVDDQKKTEKLIPEKRFKAALADATSKLQKQLDEANAKLSEFVKTPEIDREKDPDGYDRQLRIDTSVAMMADVEDYDDMIEHFKEMEKSNPSLTEFVRNHRTPAKAAYDLAKKDIEIKELMGLKSSDEWKKFQEWKEAQAKEGSEESTKAPDKKAVAKQLASKVPNLNRSTNVKKGVSKSSEDDDGLFAGHHSVKSF